MTDDDKARLWKECYLDPMREFLLGPLWPETSPDDDDDTDQKAA